MMPVYIPQDGLYVLQERLHILQILFATLLGGPRMDAWRDCLGMLLHIPDKLSLFL